MDIKFHIGQQTAKGTKNISENLLTLVARSCSVDPKYSQTTSSALGIGGAFVSDGWVSKVEVNGDAELELTIEQIKVLFESFGFKWENGEEPDTKDIKLKIDENGFTKYLSLVKDFYFDGAYDVAEDLLVTSLKLNTMLEGYVTGNVGLVGLKYETHKNKFSATSYKTVDDKPLICLGSTIKESDTDVTATVESIDINVDRKLERKGALNSIYGKAIRPNGKGEVTLNLQFNEFDKEQYTKAQDMLQKKYKL